MARITQTHKAETQAHIIEVATQSFATIGFDQTKTKTIAKACGIAEGTLFNYFATKDELLVAVFQHLAEQAKHTEIKALPHPNDILISFVLNYTKKMNIISKNLFIDLILVSLRLGRKKPKLMQKLIALDMAMIASLKEKIEQYYDLSDVLVDSNALAEMIYTTVAGDYLFYLYDPQKTYEAYEQSVTHKLMTLLKAIPMEVIK
ncbi:MAG: TetR/AcrR family transcriptional regulator [Acholeplasmataceae bacterium]